jgi:DNA-binding GntR family transcriptional regulator
LAALSERTLRDDLRELQIGIDLHRVIAKLGGNTLLANVLNGILDRCQAYVWLDVTGQDNFAVAREEHKGIVDAICRGDKERAVELTREHISDARESILTVLRKRRSVQDILSNPS